MDIIIGECISPAINMTLVQNARVVRCWVLGVVTCWAEAGLALAASKKHRRAIQSSTNTRNNRKVDLIVTSPDLEGSAVTAPDVLGGGFGVAAVVAFALHDVPIDAATDIAGRCLSVNDKILVAEAVPDLVNVLRVVTGKGSRINLAVRLG